MTWLELVDSAAIILIERKRRAASWGR